MLSKSLQRIVRLLLALALAAPSAALGATTVGAGHTGHWYDPARSGEGWVLEILDSEQALVYWFTYDDSGNQRWLIGVGQVSGNRIDFPEMVVTSGGRFGPGFDPGQVVRTVAGRLSFTFDGCDSGSVAYDAFGLAQTLPIIRLTSTLGLDCGGGGAGVLPAWQTGSWFDPSHDGEGFTLQWISAGEALLVWFSYDAQGAQRWMMGLGQRVDGHLWFRDLISTSGGRFGPGFDPANVQRKAWGEAWLQLDCEGGVLLYESLLPGFGAGAQLPVRLTNVQGLACPLPGVDFARANWSVQPDGGPLLSEVASARLGDSAYVVGGLSSMSANSSQAWRLDLSARTWSRIADLPAPRDHGMMAAHRSALYFFGGYRTALSGRATEVWRYHPASNAWVTQPPMPVAIAAGAAVALGDYIYVVGGSGGGTGLVQRFDPASGQWTSFSVADIASRDHSAAVAFDGKIWLLGGRDHHDGRASDWVTVIDPQTRQATPGPQMKQARSGFPAVVVDGQIVVAGGESLVPRVMIASAEVYSPQEGAWRQIAPLPTPVHGAGVVAIHNRVYVLLGSSTAGGIFNRGHVQVLEPTQ